MLNPGLDIYKLFFEEVSTSWRNTSSWHSIWVYRSATLACGFPDPVEGRGHFRSWNDIRGFEIISGSERTLRNQGDQEGRGRKEVQRRLGHRPWPAADCQDMPPGLFSIHLPTPLPFSRASQNVFPCWGEEREEECGGETEQEETKEKWVAVLFSLSCFPGIREVEQVW